MTTLETKEVKTQAPPPAFFNKLVTGLLRSPLHGLMSKSTLLLTITGRKSGRQYVIPVSYVQKDEQTILCSTLRSRGWWKNLRGGADITVRLRGQDRRARATAVYDDDAAIAAGITAIVEQVPRDAKYYDVRLDDEKRPYPEDIARVAQLRVLIKIKLKE
ncbi:MAG TPA: nitroreductase family deazaflavin-dependent oxidoreductase [Chloroflexi bacterium]|nr:nitroreductase family deazaflavin-dependent oxidoreductase [Chloroflexota bacterium]